MEKVLIQAELREGKGKGEARKLRMGGFIPSILYGPNIKPTPIKIKRKENERMIKFLITHNVIAEMKLKKDGEEESLQVILKEVQRDPIKDEIIHLDFYHVSLDKPVIMEVPVILKGKSHGEEKGGILEHELRSIKLEGLPKDIPEVIEVDISNLDFGHAILIKDLKLPPSVKAVEDEEKVVVTVLRPKEEKIEEEKVEEVVEEPKVITQEKVEERRREREKEEEK